MQRINYKFLLILILAVGCIVGIVVLVQGYQVSRMGGSKSSLEHARKLLEQGKEFEAFQRLQKYVKLRPDDDEAVAEYSQLLLARALSSDATRNDIGLAFQELEAALRRNPDNDALRLQLAEFQLRVRRPTDAREHLLVLADRVAGRPEPAADDNQAVSPAQVQLLLAGSYLASADSEKAAEISAALVGYDLSNRSFAADPPASDVDADAYVMLAAILEERFNSPDAASGVLQKLVERRGNDVRAWLAIGQWRRQQGDLVAAAADIGRAFELEPDNPNCLFADFELALAQRDFDRAERVARRGRELFPNDERVYRGLAAVAMQQGRLADAEQVLLDGVERLPGKASLLLMLTDSLLQQGKLDEARQQIARIGDLYGSDSGPVGLLQSRLLVAERRWKEARERLDRTRPLVLGNPDLVRQVDLYLGQCYAALDEHDAQLEVSRRVLADDPGSLAARAGAAQALVAAGRNDEALAEFEEIASGLPQERLIEIPQVWFPLLQLRLAAQSALPTTERDWSGIDTLLEAIQESPAVSAPQYTLLRAEALVRRGEAEAARGLLEQAAETGGDPQIWAALATLALKEQGPEAARDLIARGPAGLGEDAVIMLVEAQAAAAGPAEAMAAALESIATRARRLPPDDAGRVLNSLASMRFAGGDAAAAERLWQEVVTLQPTNVRAREALLEIAVIQQDADKARQAAAAIAGAVGEMSARAKAAAAAVDILSARLLLRQAAGGDGSPDPEAMRLLDEARNKLVEAENERSGWGQIQTLFAEIESLKGNLPGAIDRLKRAVALGPANPAIVRRLVAMLYATNRLDEAQQAMSLLGDEGSEGLERISAEVELRAGKFDEAVALAERSVSGDTRNPDDLLWLGQLLARSGRQERASAVLDQAAELAPESPDVWLALFTHRFAVGATGSATAALEKAGSLMPEPRRQLVLAQGYSMLGRQGDAERLLRQAAAGWPKDVDVLRGLAVFEIRHAAPDVARATLERIDALDDDSPATAAAKGWARRSRAELVARGGGYREFRQALETMREGAGPLTPDDLVAEISLLAARPEPESWRQAIARIRDLGRLQPLTIPQRLTLAQLLDRTGQWAEARGELMSVVARPDAPSAHLALLVEQLIEHGETNSAAPWLRRLRQRSPDSPLTLALEAKLAMAEKDRERAVSFARQLMPGGSVIGESPAQLRAIGRLMEDLGFDKAADRVFEKFAATSLEGVIDRIEFLARQGRSEEALDALEARWDDLSLERTLTLAVEVVRSQPDEPQFRAAIDRVGPWLEKAARVDPGSVVVGLLTVELASLAGRESEAEGMYRRLLDRDGLTPQQRAIVANNLAFHLANPETAAEARRLIDLAIAELGPLPDLLDTRGVVRLAEDDPAGAVADLRDAVLDPSQVKFLHLAAAELAAGDANAARRALDRAREEGIGRSRLVREDAARMRSLEQSLAPAGDTTAGAEG